LNIKTKAEMILLFLARLTFIGSLKEMRGISYWVYRLNDIKKIGNS
jgi:hypothetical protein